MYYLDSNLFIYARLDKGNIGERAREIFKLLEENKISAITSSLTLDEVIFVLKRHLDYASAINYGESIFKIFNLNIVPVSGEDIAFSFDFMRKGMEPRDAIHAAVSINHGVYAIVSNGMDFKKLKDINCLSFAELLKSFAHPAK
ncbi:MAG: type II toxin-antitoxin system VapC family toxin [Candidatus Aenigmarchaeota archaeon]|nr:type II toxin-antitoxin system VapC family toxin [Candidatus Aenigmarchaeota archaeon]